MIQESHQGKLSAGAGPSKDKDDLVLHTSAVMGIKDNVSASSLLLHARRIGLGAGAALADAAQTQALADTRALQATLQKASSTASHLLRTATLCTCFPCSHSLVAYQQLIFCELRFSALCTG
jgi:hypothetical protein